MDIIKKFKLRKLNKERERLLNEFTVEDITPYRAFGHLEKA